MSILKTENLNFVYSENTPFEMAALKNVNIELPKDKALELMQDEPYKVELIEELPEGEHDYRFVGRVGQFTPIKPGCGGALLMREKDGKYNAATGTKGFRWMESKMVKEAGKESDVDISYYARLVDDAKASINEYGDVYEFMR